MTAPDPTLAIAGMLLFLAGLVNGLVIPLGRSPRIGLSAHLTAVQSGTFLVAAALLWPHVPFAAGWAGPVAGVLWLSMWGLWLALFLAGLAGTGRDLPIAGGETRGNGALQLVSSVLLYASIAGQLGAVAAVCWAMLA